MMRHFPLYPWLLRWWKMPRRNKVVSHVGTKAPEGLPTQLSEGDKTQPLDIKDVPNMLGQLECIRQELARRHLLDYTLYMDEGYKIGRHHRLIAAQLEATINDVVAIHEGRMKESESDNLRVMIFMPPRHGKSRLVSQEFPVWGMGNNPWMTWMLTSYSADLAQEFGRMTRNKMRDSEELFGVKLAEDAARADRWGLEGSHDNGIVAAGVGGAITGKGAHIAIIDDPIKNYEEASSETVRLSAYNWYQTTLRTRLAPGGAVIVVMTRWHQDDLAGRLLADMKKGADKWKVLSLPALAEGTDQLGRSDGEALWPEMYDEVSLNRTRIAMGSYMFNAMYQQHPSPPDGTMFRRKDFRYWELIDHTYVLHRDTGDERFVPEQCWHFQTVDPTASAKTTADWFVCSTWIVTPKNDLLLWDVFRAQMEGAEQPRLLLDQYRRYMPTCMGIEVNGVGRPVFQMLRNAGVPVMELNATKDKVTKAIPMGARYESHKVFHRMGAAWLGDYEDELVCFPMGAHDDQVDTASYAAILTQELASRRTGASLVELDVPNIISPV